jgi:arylsulfatase A-like enzyme
LQVVRQENPKLFFLYLAPHSPHGLALPAPWFTHLRVNSTAPRTPSWNYSASDHHWLIAQQQPLAMGEATTLDRHFQARWRCLRQTDELILALDAELQRLGLWESTYVFFSSDHGCECPPGVGFLER